MRYFSDIRYLRRLPPLLRVASIGGLLFRLGALALLTLLIISFVTDRLSSSPHAYRDSSRLSIIAPNLILLGSACSVAVNTYSARFRQPHRGPFLLDSWQSQVRAIARLSALPLCGIALALVIPPTSLAFGVVFPIGVLAAIVVGAASSEPMHTPQSG